MLSDVGDPYLYDEECDRNGEHPIGEDLYSSSFALPFAARSDWSPSLRCHPLVCITCDAERNVPRARKERPVKGTPLSSASLPATLLGTFGQVHL